MESLSQVRFLTDGILILDKIIGFSSHNLVCTLRRHFSPRKIGHVGTLDPFATGTLIVAFNQGTRLTKLLGAASKTYEASLVLGRATSTGDCTGKIINKTYVPDLTIDQVKTVLKGLIGEHWQIPPSYSAVKYCGKPLYTYARHGIEVVKLPRVIKIYKTEFLDLALGEIIFKVDCSQGTYVRVFGEELARRLGTVGYLVSLRRLKSCPFNEKEGFLLEKVISWTSVELKQQIISPVEALMRCGIPAVRLNKDLIWQIKQGRLLSWEVFMQSGQIEETKGPFMVLSLEGDLAAVLCWLESGKVQLGRYYKTIRVFSMVDN